MWCLRVTESSRLGSWFPQGQQRDKDPRSRQCEFLSCGDFAYLFRAIWYRSDIGGDLAHCAAILLQTLVCAKSDSVSPIERLVIRTHLSNELCHGLPHIIVCQVEFRGHAL